MLFEFIIMPVLGALCGATMKFADLLDEHGLKWFNKSSLLFGILWGIFGAALVVLNQLIANVTLAMTIAFIIRNRLDYFNHQVAASIIIIIFLLTTQLNATVFFVFYLIFLVFGSLKDIADSTNKKRNKIIYFITESMLYYPIPTFIYALITGEWTIFFTFTVFMIAYNSVKYFYKKKGYE